MSTTYNIEIREFNGIDYDILYPITTITNVNGLTTSLDELSSNIDSTTSRVSQNEIKIISLEDSVSSIDNEIFSITTNIDSINSSILGIQGDISDLDLEKQDAADLGSLAFKDKAGLGANGDVDGILTIANGGTGANTSSGALTSLGITISTVSINEGDALSSGAIYIYYQ